MLRIASRSKACRSLFVLGQRDLLAAKLSSVLANGPLDACAMTLTLTECRMLVRTSVTLVLLAVLISAPSITAASVRGVQPDLASQYSTSASAFRCLDGSKSIQVDRINDDYCDCLDGSDEPGTAACSNGRFYCRNKGHQPLVLNSSFVDDGICGMHLTRQLTYFHLLESVGRVKISDGLLWLYADCCDGSDELQGCKNTCKAAGSAARQELTSQSKDYAAGAKSRLKYVSQSQANKQLWKLDLTQVQKDISQQQTITDKAKGAFPHARQATFRPVDHILCLKSFAPTSVTFRLMSGCGLRPQRT